MNAFIEPQAPKLHHEDTRYAKLREEKIFAQLRVPRVFAVKPSLEIESFPTSHHQSWAKKKAR